MRVISVLHFLWIASSDAWFQQHNNLLFKRTSRLMTSSSSLASSATTTVSSIQAEIIGNGRIGSFLSEAGVCTVIGRNDNIDPKEEGKPIIITTRNDALKGIIEKCPPNRLKDLVFVQNGYLDNFLNQFGLLDNTQVLLYLSVPSKGATPVDGVTSQNPEGLTTATGIHAQTFANRLQQLGMKCNVVPSQDYRPAMFEKLIWISTYMLVGTAKKCKSVGQAGQEYKDLVERIIQELVDAVSTKEGIQFKDGTIQRLAAYTDVVADFPCGLKEFEWRNQYFYQLGDELCPNHNQLLNECKANGLISF